MKYLLAFLMVLSLSLSFSQQIESNKHGFSFPLSKGQSNSVEINKFLDEKVSRIELVQLLDKRVKELLLTDSSTYYYIASTVLLSDSTIDLERLGVRKNLSTADFKIVFKALYGQGRSNYMSDCYQPRHGLLVYGDKENLLGFIEICFECHSIHSTVDIPDFPNPSQDGFNVLKEMFRKYSMIRSEEE